jgi:hypothetical protein
MNRRFIPAARLASRIEIMRLISLEGPLINPFSVGCLRKANEEPAPGGLHGAPGVGPRNSQGGEP